MLTTQEAVLRSAAGIAASGHGTVASELLAERGAGHETHIGLRAPTSPPGERPARLSEVAGPRRSDRTVRHSSVPSLSLASPVLAAASSDAV